MLGVARQVEALNNENVMRQSRTTILATENASTVEARRMAAGSGPSRV